MSLALADKSEITPKAFAQCLKKGTEIAYSAVTKPKEGTILTVIRVMAETAVSAARSKKILFADFLKKASDVHRSVYEYALTVPKGGFNVGQMYSYIDDAEINAVLDINLGFASKAKEEEYYVDCVLTLANEYLTARLAELKSRYNSLSDTEEKKATVNEIAALQKKLKSRSLSDKL